MTQPRANKVAKLWRQRLCDPNGELTDDGKLMLSDLAKYCRAHDAPTRHDAASRVDIEATFEAIGMQKLYRRIVTLLEIDDSRTARLALMQWQPDEDAQI